MITWFYEQLHDLIKVIKHKSKVRLFIHALETKYELYCKQKLFLKMMIIIIPVIIIIIMIIILTNAYRQGSNLR